MMERRHLISGLVTVILSCVAIMFLLPDSVIPNAIPATLIFLCLVILRMVISHRQEGNDDRNKTDGDSPDSKPEY